MSDFGSNLFEINQVLQVHGSMFKNVTDAFTYPCESTKVEIIKLEELYGLKQIISIENVKKKMCSF